MDGTCKIAIGYWQTLCHSGLTEALKLIPKALPSKVRRASDEGEEQGQRKKQKACAIHSVSFPKLV